MPQAIVGATVSAGVSTFLATEATIAATSSFLGFAASTASAFFARSFVTSLVLGALSQAMTKKPSSPQLGSNVTGRNPVSPHKVIYGKSRVGGNIVYMSATDDNKYLHMVIAVAGHEIESFDAIYADDKELVIVDNFSDENSDYGNKIRVLYKLGTETQTAFSDLISETAGTDYEWTSDHKLLGSALAYIRLEYDQDKFPNGVPNFTFKVRGKKVYDPRTETTVWSQNPALCLNDYLSNSRYGLGCSLSEIDQDVLIAAANICDEQVDLLDTTTQNRYECNGSFSTSSTPENVINQLLTSMAGKAVFSSGKWRIIAGSYNPVTLTFDEDDLRSGLSVNTLISRRETFNSVHGVFLSEQGVTDGLPYVMAEFPPVVSDTFIAQDGQEVKRNIELPFTTNSVMAQRLAKIELLKARQQISLTLPLKLNGLKANVGDIIGVNNTRLGWNNKKFEVVSMNISLGLSIGVNLDLREISTDVYDWSTDEESPFDPAPNTTLPNGFYVAPPTNFAYETFAYESAGGSIVRDVNLTWDISPDSFVDFYEIWWSRDDFAAGTWYTVTTKNNSFYFESVLTGDYNIRIYAVSILGVRSDPIESIATIDVDTIAPDAPTALSIESNGFKSAYLSWTNPDSKDYFQTIIYVSISNDSDTALEAGRVSGTSITYSGLPDSTTWYVWLKAVDYSGNISAFNTTRYNGTSFSTDSNLYDDIANVEDNIVVIQDDISAIELSLNNKLSASSSYTLTGVVDVQNTGGIQAGSVTWNSVTGAVTGGTGVVVTENGITGVKSGDVTFAVTNEGDAIFAGDVTTGGDGNFYGLNGSTVQVGGYDLDYSVYGQGDGGTSGKVRAGVLGTSYAPSAVFSIGVVGSASGGFGVYGQGGTVGGYFVGASTGSYGLLAASYGGSASEVGLNISSGQLAWGAYTWSMPTGSASQFMRADGSWAAPSRTYTANSGSATGTTSVSLLGSTSTGIAGAYVGTSGSGSTVTWTVQTTSPSDRRLKENIADCTFGLDFVNALQPKSYQLKADERHQTGFGFIADEVAAIDDVYGTSLVYREENWQVGDEVGFDTIHYPSYIPILVKAIQELSAENSSLKARIEALESK